MTALNFRLLFQVMVIAALICFGAAAGKSQRDHAHQGWVAQSPTSAIQPGTPR